MDNNRFFASDNAAGVHPAVMDAIVAANVGHAIAYGDDPWTKEATKILMRLFGRSSFPFFVYNGTGANVTGIQAAVSSYHGVICSETSHLNVDECGAIENFSGAKLLPVATDNGQLLPEQILPFLANLRGEHHSQPRVVSITQSSELGTLYSPELIREIARVCHKNDLYLHLDGARISNAAAALSADLGDITAKLGVDILSLGGTKNGLMFGEAVIFFRSELARKFRFIRKQGMQLASKMRYIAAQFSALFSSDLWLRNARHANSMATRLSNKLSALPGVDIVYPTEANAVFASLPRSTIEAVLKEMFFYVWDEGAHVIRLMAAFDTQEEEISRLTALVQRHL